jgi:hypothetical protein
MSSPPVKKTCASPGTSNNRDVSSLTLSGRKAGNLIKVLRTLQFGIVIVTPSQTVCSSEI